jgi:16S rRNA (guanine527-N7)-methyltransferase
MHPAQIAPLLVPFLEDEALPPAQLSNISIYIDLLSRWNTRLNLTAIRRPEDIVTRHLGESLFAARHLFPRSPAPDKKEPASTSLAEPDHAGAPPLSRPLRQGGGSELTHTLADLGSGPGFPGIPIKLWAPDVHVTLIESHQKKATFLREVLRATKLTNIDVLSARVSLATPPWHTVTLRAVDRFEEILPVAAALVRPAGRLALLIGEEQLPTARACLPFFNWFHTVPLPASRHRLLAVAQSPSQS